MDMPTSATPWFLVRCYRDLVASTQAIVQFLRNAAEKMVTAGWHVLNK
jgi:hypothetical protein